MINVTTLIPTLTRRFCCVTGVADSVLAPLVNHLPARAPLHIPACNEGAACSLATGHWLADGRTPALV